MRVLEAPVGSAALAVPAGSKISLICLAACLAADSAKVRDEAMAQRREETCKKPLQLPLKRLLSVQKKSCRSINM